MFETDSSRMEQKNGGIFAGEECKSEERKRLPRRKGGCTFRLDESFIVNEPRGC